MAQNITPSDSFPLPSVIHSGPRWVEGEKVELLLNGQGAFGTILSARSRRRGRHLALLVRVHLDRQVRSGGELTDTVAVLVWPNGRMVDSPSEGLAVAR